MKKFLSILMAVTMMATVLAGCGAKEEKPAASAPAAFLKQKDPCPRRNKQIPERFRRLGKRSGRL